jgi:hypothetical protein
MKNLTLSAALFAALCLPALAQNGQGGNNNNQGGNNNNQGGYRGVPGPIAGAGLPVIAVGYGVYWLIKRRRRKVTKLFEAK